MKYKQKKTNQKKILPKTVEKRKELDLNDTHDHKKKIIWFCLKFFLIFFILSYVVEQLNIVFFTNTLANIVGKILGATIVGNTIYSSGGTYVITNSCTGLLSASILASIIFALRKPMLKQKILLFLIGLILLLVMNIPRILLVVYSAMIGFDAELIHELTWFVMSGIILFVWYYGNKKLFGIKDFSKLV